MLFPITINLYSFKGKFYNYTFVGRHTEGSVTRA